MRKFICLIVGILLPTMLPATAIPVYGTEEQNNTSIVESYTDDGGGCTYEIQI